MGNGWNLVTIGHLLTFQTSVLVAQQESKNVSVESFSEFKRLYSVCCVIKTVPICFKQHRAIHQVQNVDVFTSKQSVGQELRSSALHCNLWVLHFHTPPSHFQKGNHGEKFGGLSYSSLPAHDFAALKAWGDSSCLLFPNVPLQSGENRRHHKLRQMFGDLIFKVFLVEM